MLKVINKLNKSKNNYENRLYIYILYIYIFYFYSLFYVFRKILSLSGFPPPPTIYKNSLNKCNHNKINILFHYE